MTISEYSRAYKVIEEATTALEFLRELPEDFWNDLIRLIRERTGKIVLMGIGKSGYVAMKMAATLTSLGHYATFVHPVEAMHGDSGTVANGDVVIAFSFSGNTKELVECVKHLKRNGGIILIGVTGGGESSLAALSDRVVPVRIREEGCPLMLAPMASTTAMLVIGDALAAGLTSPEHFTQRDFARFHPSGTLGLSLTPVSERALFSSEHIIDSDTPIQKVLTHMSVIGKGIVGVENDSGTLVGSITDGDIRRYFESHTSHGDACAQDIMSTTPKYIRQDQDLLEALSLMESHKITNLFVVDERSKPVGIIHIHDIISP
jgi:arabinose-5-phosphate isomerase